MSTQVSYVKRAQCNQTKTRTLDHMFTWSFKTIGLGILCCSPYAISTSFANNL